jgi:hypothetical protein
MNVVHDGANVIHPLFKRRSAGYAIGQSLPSLVECDDTRECRKTAQEGRITQELV